MTPGELSDEYFEASEQQGEGPNPLIDDEEECRAKRWNGTPAYDGPHPWHFFTYGPGGCYTGSCRGR